MDRGAWQATVHGVAKESDTTEQLTRGRKKKKPLEVAGFSESPSSCLSLEWMDREWPHLKGIFLGTPKRDVCAGALRKDPT